MRVEAAVAVPPPPSSVVTNTLPRASTALSNMPAASISRIVIDQGAPKPRIAATQAACWPASSR